MSEPPDQPPNQPPYPSQPNDAGEPNQPSWGRGGDDQPGGYRQPGPPPDPYGQGGYRQGGYAQTGYPPAGYTPGGYQQGGFQYGGEQPYPYGTPPAPAGSGFVLNLGARVRVRPEPRFGISMAAAGIGIAIVGILVWSFGYLIQGIRLSSSGFEGGERRFLGFGLSLIVVLVGYGLAITRKRGPLATAGAVGAALGVPLALTFLTFDLSGASSGLPANTDLIYVLSVLVYLATYLLVPGMRGRSFLLGLAALLFASYVELKVASGSVTRASSTIFGGSGFDSNDFGTGGLTAVALVFGLIYLGLAAFLDLRGVHGAATAMVVAGTFTVLGGVAYGVLTFKQTGTGIELIVLGAALSFYGARFGRRFTTWFWMFALVAGFGLVVQKALPDSPAGSGITLIVIGLVVVVLAQVVATVLHEAPDVDESTSVDGAAAVGGHRH